jgi:hypothetical protein
MERPVRLQGALSRQNGQMLSTDDWSRARVVDEDIEYLIERWRPSLDETSLRRDSPMLRRLLVDGQYARAWRDLGLPGEPYISGSDFWAALGETTRKYIQYATAPPGVTVAHSLIAGGQLHMTVLQKAAEGAAMGMAPGYSQAFGLLVAVIPPEDFNGISAEKAVAEHIQPGRRRVVGLPVSKFLASPFALILGREITRREVIQYVAHKLGGAHFDPGRARKGDDRLELLDRLANTRLEVRAQRPINAVYVELLSIAEWLAESNDAARFRDVFRRTPQPPQPEAP